MSCDKWFYHPDVCDGNICPGDCDLCSIPKNPPEDLCEDILDDETEEEIEREIMAARKGEE